MFTHKHRFLPRNNYICLITEIYTFMNIKQQILGLSAFGMAAISCAPTQKEEEKAKHPNIVVIYVDDLGYGDVSCYGAERVQTPNIDALANNGVRFTDGHCSAATCTPSRYSLLTGSYAFRNNAAILPGNAPLLIRPGTETLPGMLQRAGYKTGVVGKWHLGLGDGNLDWNGDIKPGPLEIGFDYCYLLPATGDRVPCVWVEDYEVLELDKHDPITVSYDERIGDEPSGLERPDLLKWTADTQHSQTIVNGVSRIGYMTGGNSARWKDEQFPYKMLHRGRKFIDKYKDDPFFLYFAFHDIHVPRVPHPKFKGATEMGPRGDVIAQMDWVTGQLVDHLKKAGVYDNTIIIFSSDNGPILDDGYDDQAVELLGDHQPSGPFRGGKYSAFEAGTRVPFIISWPGVIVPGVSDALVSQVDFYASFAKLVGQEIPEDGGPDSQEMLDVFMGKSNEGRNELFEEAFAFAIRKGDWKFIQKSDKPIPDWLQNKDVETGMRDEDLLYNLKKDPGEQNNLAEEHPEKVKELKALIQHVLENPTR